MSKLNSLIKKHINLIIIVFLYLQPFLDLITSLEINLFSRSITMGIIIKMIFLLFIIYYGLFIDKQKNIKIIYLIICGLFCTIFIGYTIYYKGFNCLFYELNNLFKIFYLPILIMFLYNLDLKIDYKVIIRIIIIYLLMIFIPTILKINFNSYTQGKNGSVGLFNSGNEISAVLSILCPFLIYYLFDNNKLYKKLILSLLSLIVFFNMGSKIIIISLVISLICNIVWFNKTKFKIKSLLFTGIIIITSLILLIPKTNFYKNIVTHATYLGINNISDLLSYNAINRFIFSDRLTYLSITHNNYINSNCIMKFIGIGYINNYGTDEITLKTIEMDFFDIFYRMGICGFMIFIYPFYYFIHDIKNKVYIKDKYNKNINLSLFIGFICAFLVGHCLVAPGVSIYLLIFILLKKERCLS